MSRTTMAVLGCAFMVALGLGCDEEEVEADDSDQPDEVEQAQEQPDEGADEEAEAQKDEGFFDDVTGDVAVYSEIYGGNQGVTALQTEDHIVEFCYEETGCEDRSDSDDVGMMSSTSDKGRLHESDPDKTVVGVRVAYEIHPMSNDSGIAVVAEGTHRPDETLPVDQFEIERRLMESEPYSRGDTVSFELGITD